MQRFFLTCAALATTVLVLYGGASGIPQLPPPLATPVISPTIINAPPASNFTSTTPNSAVPNACGIPTQSDTIPTVGGTTLINASVNRLPCTPSCAACNPSQGKMPGLEIFKRALKLLFHGWSKRTLKTPADYDGDLTRFLLRQFLTAEILPIQRGGGDQSTGYIRVLKDRAFDSAVIGLYGCTSVVVVSKSAIWLSHFWEIPGFRATIEDWRLRALPPTREDIINFNENVINLMRDGGPYIAGLQQATARGGYFSAAEEPKAIIVTPRARRNRGSQYEYGSEVAKIIRTLGTLFPISSPLVIDYVPKPDEGDQARTVAGKILVQYDPQHDFLPSTTNTCFSYQRAMVRVWVEERSQPVFEREWTASEIQTIAKRDFFAINCTRPGGQSWA